MLTTRPSQFPHLAANRAAIGHPVPLSVHEAELPHLLPMTLTSLNDALGTWLLTRVHPGITLVPGGWEDWAQLDLLGWLHDSLGATRERIWDARRNVHIYEDPDERVDLLFNATTHDAVNAMVAVEILAQSPQVERPDFLNRMHHEAEQLQMRHVKAPYTTARRMMLALTLDPTTSTVLQKHGFGAVVSTPTGCAAMWREIGG